MGLKETVGPFFGVSQQKKKNVTEEFNLYDKHTTMDLKRRAKGSLPYNYKKKFFNTLEEHDLKGKKLSNRQILDLMKKEHGYQFKDKIKKRLLTDYHEAKEELTEKEKRRNIAMSNYYRHKEMQDEEAKVSEERTGLARRQYGSGSIRATAKRAGVDPEHHDNPTHQLSDKYRRPI